MSEKKANYTSGSWTVKPSEDMVGHYILAEFAEKQRRVYHGGNPDGIDIKDLNAEERANAVLMEAAPDLLEVCKAVKVWMYDPASCDLGEEDIYNIAEAAIAKATK